MKKCGYSFWGYLGDIKYDREGNVASTPDGNAFYSWCIIRELQKRGYEVTQIMPDRDVKGYKLMGEKLFSSWLMLERKSAYVNARKIDYGIIYDYLKMFIGGNLTGKEEKRIFDIIKNTIYNIIEVVCKDFDFILHEYRMLIPGRNDLGSFFSKGWQPDYLIQECLFEYCYKKHKRLIIFDLDYKLDFGVYHYLSNGCPVTIFELGTKWIKYRSISPISTDISVKQVFIPFDFDNIDYFNLSSIRDKNLVYIGNRYERDWCIDKYISEYLEKCIIYGNWLESGRDSAKRWKNLRFGSRLQTADMRGVYGTSISTILLAKKEYCDYGFMTARILEAIFYGTVPLFIEEYGDKTIKTYAGDYADFLTVRNDTDICRKVEELRTLSGGNWVKVIIEYMREYLKFMDVKNFVDAIEEVK